MRVPPFTSMIRAKKSTPTVGSESYKKIGKIIKKTKVSETQDWAHLLFNCLLIDVALQMISNLRRFSLSISLLKHVSAYQ